MNTLKKNEKGFTIIEVVLVLAIAGLIFLMVFIALPALQRSQRNTQRTQDLNRISTQVTNYMSSSRQAAPKDESEVRSFATNYLRPADEYMDPTGESYRLSANTLSGEAGSAGDVPVRLVGGKTCDASQADGVSTTGSPRQFALQILLEGQTVPYCIDN